MILDMEGAGRFRPAVTPDAVQDDQQSRRRRILHFIPMKVLATGSPTAQQGWKDEWWGGPHRSELAHPGGESITGQNCLLAANVENEC